MIHASSHEFTSLLRMVSDASSKAAIEGVLRRATEFFGAAYYLHGMRLSHGSNSAVQPVLTNYLERWQERYDELDASEIDPVLKRAELTTQPFTWDELRGITKRQHQVMGEAAAHGLAFGITAPVHGPRGNFSLTCYASPTAMWCSDAERQEMLKCIALVALGLHEATVRVLSSSTEEITLNAAERRTLTLLSRGLSAKQVAAELDVSVWTIPYYLGRAIKKMGAKSMREAITRAIVQGLIQAQDYPVRVFDPD